MMKRAKSGISGSIIYHSDLDSRRIRFISNNLSECELEEIEYDKIVFKQFVRSQQYRSINFDYIRMQINKQIKNINDNNNYCKAIGEIANNFLVINVFQDFNNSPFYISKKKNIVLFAIVESCCGYEIMSVYEKFSGDIWDMSFLKHDWINLIIYLLDAVSKLHQSGYYHLDIKLSNILYNNKCNKIQYSLCDFGSLTDINCENTTRGTRPYMSPLIDFNKQEFKNHYCKLLKTPLVDNYFDSYKKMRKIQMHVVLPYFESITPGGELNQDEIYNPEIIDLMNTMFQNYPHILNKYLSHTLDGLKYTAIQIQQLILQKTDLHAIGISLLALAEKHFLFIENILDEWIYHLILGEVNLNYYSAELARLNFMKIIS